VRCGYSFCRYWWIR